jgi:hypothetical protein
LALTGKVVPHALIPCEPTQLITAGLQVGAPRLRHPERTPSRRPASRLLARFSLLTVGRIGSAGG